jgi:aspartate racemase
MKKIAGIIAGLGPQSTIEYYRGIIHEYRKLNPDGSYPSILLNSINLQRVLDWMASDQLESVADYLADEIERLARAGSSFAAISANTPHIVFREVQRRSAIPLLSIVEATCAEAQNLKITRLALLGTRYTMQAKFYPDVFTKENLTIIIPNENEQALIHEKYLNELVRGIFLPETRHQLLQIIETMKNRDGVEGVILGGTELPLILSDPPPGIQFLNTTKIHVHRIVTELLSD